MKHSPATNDLHNQLRLEQTFIFIKTKSSKPADPGCAGDQL